MPAATFDTHKLVKKLQEAGFPEKQAETLSEVFQDTQEIQLQDLVTKHDLKELELKIDAQLLLLKWMTGVMLAGVISLIIKAFLT